MKKLVKSDIDEELDQNITDLVDEFNTQVMDPDSELRKLLSGYVDDAILEEALIAAMQTFNEIILG